MFFGLLGWIVLGIVAGFIASKMVNLHGDDPNMGIALGAGGALVGGWLYSMMTGAAIVPFNIMSMVVAVAAGVTVLAIWHAWRAKSA